MTLSRFHGRLLAGLALLLLLASTARALESADVTSRRAIATLVSDMDSIAPGEAFRVALRLRLADGWHTYWQNPGDAGAPPRIDLSLPEGAKAGGIQWPTPRRLAEGDLMTYAYTGSVLFPIAITPGPVRDSLTVTAQATWLVCKDICVPEEGSFTLTLAIGVRNPSGQAALFADHDRSVPRPSPWAASVTQEGTLWVRGDELSRQSVTDAWFIPDKPGQIQDDAAQPLTIRQGEFSLALRLSPNRKPDQPIGGILTVVDGSGQLTNVTIRAETTTAASAPDLPLARILAFAFLGGLILNLMPCVFPVLAMKALSLARGAAAGSVRAHAVAYTAGVVTMFLALGAALLVAREAGAAAGWGFQFQSPLFVTLIAWLLFAVGLNLSGVFQIGGGIAGAGSSLAGKGGHAGSYFTGLLAVLVATPCTAPFMGVAIAAGLSAPPATTMLVFLFLGLGLAAPYGLLASAPGLVRAMPRPGMWMEVLKQALAFPMYGAVVWLLWVLAQQTGADGLPPALLGLVILGFGAWVFGLSQIVQSRVGQFVSRLVAVAAAVALLAVLGTIDPMARPVPIRDVGVEAFSPVRLAALRAEGRPVFVNMTAAWCVTCLVNERVALSTDAVREAFAARQIVYLKGDWTRQDPDITTYLRQNGRDGVPLYVFYPAGGGPPAVLPQILTAGIVLSALGAPSG